MHVKRCIYDSSKSLLLVLRNKYYSTSSNKLQNYKYDLSEFVPKHEQVKKEQIEELQQFIDSSKRLFVLTGAGISTESGIPDYRSEVVGLYAKSGHKPIQHQDFIQSKNIRRRYWARNYLGWPKWSSVEPNINHYTLADWESKSKVHWCITQNVDRLHHKAGSQNIIELHGSSYTVKCLSCKYRVSRFQFQQILSQLNSHLLDDELINIDAVRPDGDVDINPEFINSFSYPSCPSCNGIVKPDIVFFGDNVPKDRVDLVYEKLDQSDSVLIIGSSLHVYSGYRFALSAFQSKKPIAIVNIGLVRNESFSCDIRINARAGDVLPQIKI